MSAPGQGLGFIFVGGMKESPNNSMKDSLVCLTHF